MLASFVVSADVSKGLSCVAPWSFFLLPEETRYNESRRPLGACPLFRLGLASGPWISACRV